MLHRFWDRPIQRRIRHALETWVMGHWKSPKMVSFNRAYTILSRFCTPMLTRDIDRGIACDGQVIQCNEAWPEPSDIWRRSYTFFILTTTYLLPLGLLSLTYGSVGHQLWLHTAPGNADEARDTQQLRSKRKVCRRHNGSFHGRPARSAAMPVLFLLSGPKMGFAPRRGDTLPR